jgi:hypothetical protein
VSRKRVALALNVAGFLALCVAGALECEPCRKGAAVPEGGADGPPVGADT